MPSPPSEPEFQSAPGFGAGGNPKTQEYYLEEDLFQSAPGFGAGGNSLWLIASCTHGTVSIRPRLWGRGKRLRIIRNPRSTQFQSAPGFGAGGNVMRESGQTSRQSFQSAPGFGAGGNKSYKRAKRQGQCFNPPPALGPGETGS